MGRIVVCEQNSEYILHPGGVPPLLPWGIPELSYGGTFIVPGRISPSIQWGYAWACGGPPPGVGALWGRGSGGGEVRARRPAPYRPGGRPGRQEITCFRSVEHSAGAGARGEVEMKMHGVADAVLEA